MKIKKITERMPHPTLSSLGEKIGQSSRTLIIVAPQLGMRAPHIPKAAGEPKF
jgi:hypothetical protein